MEKGGRDPIPPRIRSCVVCGARAECLKASHLWGVRKDTRRLEQVVNEIRYNRRLLRTAELEAGRRAHEALETMRGVEKNPSRAIDSINRRARPFYMTATFCSPTFGGLRCQPDAIYVVASGSTLRPLIIEDKTSNQSRYYTQLYAEAVILTDYQRTEARFDKTCELRAEYVKGFCDRYKVPVEFNFTCDSWRRNTETPARFV